MTPDENEPDGDPRDEIARLETQIDELAETIEGCRKLILMAKVAIAGGAIALLAMLLGAIRDDAVVLAGATAALMGGIVVLGSNTSTSNQALAKMKDAEARRAALIDALELRLVHGRTVEQPM
jgi:hypothetical protein